MVSDLDAKCAFHFSNYDFRFECEVIECCNVKQCTTSFTSFEKLTKTLISIQFQNSKSTQLLRSQNHALCAPRKWSFDYWL